MTTCGVKRVGIEHGYDQKNPNMIKRGILAPILGGKNTNKIREAWACTKGGEAKKKYKGAQLEGEGNKELEQMHRQTNSITYKTTRKMMELICIHVKILRFPTTRRPHDHNM